MLSYSNKKKNTWLFFLQPLNMINLVYRVSKLETWHVYVNLLPLTKWFSSSSFVRVCIFGIFISISWDFRSERCSTCMDSKNWVQKSLERWFGECGYAGLSGVINHTKRGRESPNKPSGGGRPKRVVVGGGWGIG